MFTDSGVMKFSYRGKLFPGSTFGELGILEGKTRSALIICSTDAEFAIMEKEDYSELLAKRDRSRLQKKFEFIKQHIFPDLTNETIKKIFYAFQKRALIKNEVLFTEGDAPTRIYLIKKGEVQLARSLQQDHVREKHVTVERRSKRADNGGEDNDDTMATHQLNGVALLRRKNKSNKAVPSRLS